MNPRTAMIVIAVSLAGTCSLAHAQSYWTTQMGFWHVPTNWDTGTPPTESDTAIIANGGTSFVQHEINIGAGIFGLNDGGQFNDGTLILNRNAKMNFGGLGIALFGRDQGTSGNLVMEDGTTLTCRSTLQWGLQGNTSSQIKDGSLIEADSIFIAGTRNAPNRTFTSHATIDISGRDTLVRTTPSGNPNSSNFVIGAGGSAQVTVRNGGRIETTNGLLLSSTSQGSNLIIEGPNSAVQVSGTYFDTGRDITLPDDHTPVGDAVLTLRNGGTLDASQTSRAMIFATHTRIEGAGTIMGDGSLYEGATIDAGESDSFGNLTFTDQLDTSFGGTLHFDIGSINDFDQLTVNDLIAGGTIEVSIADSFIAEFGQSFDIINTDTLSGDFDLIELPELQGSLYFDAEIYAEGITLHVVPTPATLLAIGMPMLMRLRRRAGL